MSEQKTRKKSLLERAAQSLDLPAHAITSLPYLQLIGDTELRVANHKGILAYSEEEIHISGHSILLKILGSELELRTMTALELLITGTISSITLE